jgi:hypothetical protein
MTEMGKLSDEVIEAGARLLFDKANPDTLMSSDLDRDKWFEDTRDYWIRATRELAATLGTPMTVNCPCGYSVSGPADMVRQTVFYHRTCETGRAAFNG